MVHVIQPFNNQKAVSPFHIPGYVILVRLWQLPDIRPRFQFLGQVKYRHEEIRKGIMLQEILILQQTEEKSPVPDQGLFQMEEITPVDINDIGILFQLLAQVGKLLCRPVAGDDQVLSYLFRVWVEGGKLFHEFFPNLTEERPYDHVHLFQKDAFFPQVQYPVNDQCNQENLNKNKGYIIDKIKENLMGVPEYCIMDEIDAYGKGYHNKPKKYLPF